MIVGFDHLSLNTQTFDQTLEMLTNHGGYRIQFVDKNAENHVLKKSYLSKYSPHHHLALLVPQKGAQPVIELLDHGSVHASHSPINIVQDYIEIKVANKLAEKQFWIQMFGFFEPVPDHLRLMRPFPKWCCHLYFCEDKTVEKSPYFLNTTGYACLAFISNNLEEDHKKALALGAKDTVRFSVEINHNELDILLFRTPAGVICEVFQRIRRP